MSKTSLACWLGLVLALHTPGALASITCEVLRPPAIHSLQQSSAVLAATAEAISLREVDGEIRQTIIWRVNESWKGVHPKGSTFTTRTNVVEPIRGGQAFLLYLSGKE